jgi:hypothetical protein
MIGWIGLGLLMSAYLLLVTPLKKYFIPIDTIASAVLTVHATTINDYVFICVNGWITLILAWKWYKGEYGV